MIRANSTFLKDYLNLFFNNTSYRNIYWLTSYESFAAILNFLGVMVVGLVTQLILTKFESANVLSEGILHSVLQFLTTIDFQILIFTLVLISVGLASCAAYIEFRSAKYVRNLSRQRYELTLRKHLINFAGVEHPPSLELQDLPYFKSSFTIDLHLTYMAYEALLRSFRPVAVAVIFAVPLIIIDYRVVFLLLLIVLICIPFLIIIYKKTASSAKSVFGAKRRAVYAEINSLVTKHDSFGGEPTAISSNSKAIDWAKFEEMLDSFDFWKLSADRTSCILQIIQSTAIQLGIFSVAWISFVVEARDVPTLVILALGLQKVISSIFNLFTRLTVLSRMFPVVHRFSRLFRLVGSVNERPKLTNSDEKSHSGGAGKIFLIYGTRGFKRSEYRPIANKLSDFAPGFKFEYLDVASGARLGSLTHTQQSFSELFSKLSHDQPLSPQVLELIRRCEIVMDGDEQEDNHASTVWRRADPKARILLNYLLINYSDKYGYIHCEPNQIRGLRESWMYYEIKPNKPVFIFSQSENNEVEEYVDCIVDIREYKSNVPLEVLE